MSALESWLRGVLQAVERLGRQPVLDLEGSGTPSVSRKLAADGFPGILPLWTGRRHAVGLMVTPESDFTTWQGIIIQDGQGLTISSDARTLLPQFLVQRILSNSPQGASALGELWGEIEADALRLHTVLGGRDETLEVVAAVARDPTARDTFRYVSGKEAMFEAAHSALNRKVDRSEAFAHYADWLDACVAHVWATPDNLLLFGPWQRRVLCWTHRLKTSGKVTTPRTMPAMLSIIEANAGIDSGVPSEPSWSVHAAESSAAAALVATALDLSESIEGSDPVSAGLITALITEEEAYRGLAHAEAAVVFDERGESYRAWGALQSSIWWAARNLGTTPPAMLEALRFLVTRHGWGDVIWAIERGIQAIP